MSQYTIISNNISNNAITFSNSVGPVSKILTQSIVEPKSIEYIASILCEESWQYTNYNGIRVFCISEKIFKELFIDVKINYKISSNADIASAEIIIKILQSFLNEFKLMNVNLEKKKNLLPYTDCQDILQKLIEYRSTIKKNNLVISELNKIINKLNLLLEENNTAQGFLLNKIFERKSLLTLFEGLELNDSDYQQPIQKYIFNDLIMREITSFIPLGFEDSIFKYFFDDEVGKFIKIY